ncbi:MAG: hypothetical protein DRJ32_07635 [Thermoprotei archaeon]|nr:MAG: hypothetical protein DRJ32_07635 [Thermoprotei archaeon]
MLAKKSMKISPILVAYIIFTILIASIAPAVYAQSYNITADTDKRDYKRGETIHVSGRVTSDGSGVSATVGYEVKDPNGNRKDFGSVNTDNQGYFSFSVTSGSTWALGEYKITLKISGTTVSKTINFYLKDTSTISLRARPSEVAVGQSVTLEGSISPNPGVVSVKIYIYSTSGWKLLKTVSTGSTGRYSCSWTPQQKGTFKFKAKWDGNDKYFGAESSVVKVIVGKKASSISLEIMPEDAELYSIITVKGSLSPSLDNVEITLEYTKPNGQIIKKTTRTDSEGKFVDTINATMFGEWKVAASWAGNEDYAGCKKSRTFTVWASPTLTLVPSATVVLPDSTVYLVGKLTPYVPGLTVEIYYSRYGGEIHCLVQLRLTKAGYMFSNGE